MRRYILSFTAFALIVVAGCAGQQKAAKEKDEGPKIFLSEELLADENALPAWLAYGMALITWHEDHRGDRTPDLYEREVFARGLMAYLWGSMKNDGSVKPDADLDALEKVSRNGFIREYTWVYLRGPDWQKPKDLKLKEFDAWRDIHLQGHVPVLNPGVIIEGLPGSAPTKPVRTVEFEMYCNTGSVDAKRSYDKANEALTRKELETAKHYYMEAIALDPKFCDAMDNLGMTLRQLGEIDEAVQWYRRSIELNQANPVPHANLGLIYILQKNYDAALASYQKAAGLTPDNPEGHYGMGNALFQQNKFDEALISFGKAAALYEKNGSPLVSDAHYFLGLCHFNLEQYAKAAEYFRLAEGKFSDKASVNYYLGLCYLTEELYDRDAANRYIGLAQKQGAVIPEDVRRRLER